ncbi:MAG: DUF5343 domain-containing protein [bacterium]|nr:DUF5343 domain-containing protein [bacterium]
MPDYPYTTVPGRIRSFLEIIRSVSVPEKANRAWLPKIGFNSSNDRTILGVLKFIGFINERGNPTDKWKEYRRANHEQVLGDSIRDAYHSLFEIHENPCSKSTSELKDFFRAETESAEGTVSKMVDTFNALCRMAQFKTSSAESIEEILPKNLGIKLQDVGLKAKSGRLSQDRIVTINIHLNLPETADEEVYAKIFRMMKEHLL